MNIAQCIFFKVLLLSCATQQDDTVPVFLSDMVWSTKTLSDVLKLPDTFPDKEMMKRSCKIEKSLSALQRGVSNIRPCSALTAEK